MMGHAVRRCAKRSTPTRSGLPAGGQPSRRSAVGQAVVLPWASTWRTAVSIVTSLAVHRRSPLADACRPAGRIPRSLLQVHHERALQPRPTARRPSTCGSTARATNGMHTTTRPAAHDQAPLHVHASLITHPGCGSVACSDHQLIARDRSCVQVTSFENNVSSCYSSSNIATHSHPPCKRRPGQIRQHHSRRRIAG
jgi:hypothetical protein